MDLCPKLIENYLVFLKSFPACRSNAVSSVANVQSPKKPSPLSTHVFFLFVLVGSVDETR